VLSGPLWAEYNLALLTGHQLFATASPLMSRIHKQWDPMSARDLRGQVQTAAQIA
jgi:hypothetical protein